MFPPSPGFISPGSDFTMNADLQRQSAFFGRLPREIRDMVYLAMWDVSGTQQHVFELEEGSGHVTHFPCSMTAGEQDSRNDEFEKLWHKQQARRPRSLVEDPVWARRMSSSWYEHWKCEEAMLVSREKGKKPGTLFLPSLLMCRRMYDEALPTLYASTTLVMTSLPLAHSLLVAAPSPNTRLWRSARLSLTVPYEQLHRHCANEFIGRRPPAPHYWAELCGALSNLVRFAALRAVVVRLDLADADRAWCDVRERWALSAVRGRLARCLVLQLPELSADVDAMRPYQFLLPPSSYPPDDATAATSSAGDDGAAVAAAIIENRRSDCISIPSKPVWRPASGAFTRIARYSTFSAPASASTSPAEGFARDVGHATANVTTSENLAGSGGGSSSSGVPSIPFQRLERYPRRRWTRVAAGDGVQARHEFFYPREHVVLGRERRRDKIRGLCRRLWTM
ncbi:hypothetical protein PG994_000153 [Apiospora phragmitis]|uniref:DUF7730 domain-containing protein n=1 Tax=Apiospora phragmitis TaxID=2905665 RepID=A0ABR1X5F7_9PEZI